MTIDIGATEITLALRTLRLKLSPYGASLRGLWREQPEGVRQEIITGYTGARGKVGGQGDVLIPFPGRVRQGRYVFQGQSYQMVCNDKDGPNAIHGFLRMEPWEITAQSEQSIAFSALLQADQHPGYPFALRASVTYTLHESGMDCGFLIENMGDSAAPVAAGFHPYFTVGSGQGKDWIDTATLQVPMTSTLEMENLLPTGRLLPVKNTPYDFLHPRPIGATLFNTCYAGPQRDPDGLLRFRLTGQDTLRTLTVWMDTAFDYVVLYSGDPLPESHRRRSLAIEPMSCGSDAFNHPEWGLVILQPGQKHRGLWGVSL